MEKAVIKKEVGEQKKKKRGISHEHDNYLGDKACKKNWEECSWSSANRRNIERAHYDS